MNFIRVAKPANREIFLNREYSESVGTSPLTIPVGPGSHKFETLITIGPDRFIDFAGRVDDLPDRTDLTIELAPVEPPQKVLP